MLARPDYGADAEQRCDLVAGPRRVAAGLARHVRRAAARPAGREAGLVAGRHLGHAAAEDRRADPLRLRGRRHPRARRRPTPRRRSAAYAEDLGLAFQIQDDLLDRGGEGVATGKDAGRDDAVGKATFVGVLGEDGARRMLGRAARRARSADLTSSPAAPRSWRELFDFVINRKS